MSIPLIIHQVWLGGALPKDFVGYRNRLIELNDGFLHQQWDEKTLASIGFDCAKAAAKFPSLAGVSNAARLFVLRKFGGFYFDHDFVALRPLLPLTQLGTALACKQRDGRICNAFLSATPGHEWINRQCDLVGEYEKLAAFWGVDLASRVSREGLTILPDYYMYPYMWADPIEKRVAHADSYMVHLWDSSWVPKHA